MRCVSVTSRESLTGVNEKPPAKPVDVYFNLSNTVTIFCIPSF